MAVPDFFKEEDGIRDYFTCSLPVAFKRALGLGFDCLILTILAFIPFIFHSLVEPGFHKQFHSLLDISAALSSPNASTIWGPFALLTPLPLVNLRLFCKCFLRMRTPGEMLCGYSSVALEPGWAAVLSHVIFGVGQYLAMLFSFIISMMLGFISAIPVMALLGKGFFYDIGNEFFAGLFMSIAMVWFWFVLAQYYLPESAGVVTGGLESICGQIGLAGKGKLKVSQ